MFVFPKIWRVSFLAISDLRFSLLTYYRRLITFLEIFKTFQNVNFSNLKLKVFQIQFLFLYNDSSEDAHGLH